MENKRLIEKIRAEIVTADFPSVYEPEKWKDIKEYTSGLQYALDLKNINLNKSLNVGDILGIRVLPFMHSKHLEEILREEWEMLGLKVEYSHGDMFKVVNTKRQNIAVFLSGECKYWHFVRQDRDGNWSHQMGNGGKIEVLNDLPAGMICPIKGCGNVKLMLYCTFSLTK